MSRNKSVTMQIIAKTKKKKRKEKKKEKKELSVKRNLISLIE